MRDFRTLKAWQKSHQFALNVYRASKAFPDDEKYGLTSQLRRSSMSIGFNLAEGCGRGSNAGYARFVHIAAGSATESECQILLARDLGYLSDRVSDELDAQIQEIKRMLNGLTRSLGS